MATGGFQIPGLISGLSTGDLIQKIMDMERMPLVSLQNRKDQIQTKADALRDINSRVSALMVKVQALNLRSTIDARTVTTDTPSGSAPFLSGSATTDAAIGSFIVRVRALATATSVTSSASGSPSAIGAAVSATQPLASANFIITPTTGAFSVNGAQITIDDDTVLSDGTDAVGANTIFAKIRDATSSLAADKQVTVSWGLDDNGRQNKLVLSATGSIQLGAGSDTSNFLKAAGLAALPPSTTMTSVRNLGGVKTSALLNSVDANLDVALSSTTGSFKINGVTIDYDASTDTLNDVLNRINASGAKVTAAYDSARDRLTLTARTTGGALIDLEDVTGNFLAAMKLSESDEVVGANASYLLNGVQMYSMSNTVTDAVPGVTLNLMKADDATDVTVSVSQNAEAAVAVVEDFVSQYNSTMTLIRDKIAYNPTTKKGNILTGDSTVLSIENMLATLVAGAGEGLASEIRSLSDIGITTGGVGSAVGSTRLLQLDTSKLKEKLQSNASAVADVFGGLLATTTLSAGGTGSIESITGTPSKHISGAYSIVSDALGNLTATFTPTSGSTTTTNGTIAAGGINTTLIPGLTLTGKAVLAAGADTITTTFTTKGVGIKIVDYLANLTSSTGVFANRQSSVETQIKDIDDSIERMETRLEMREKNLYAKFRGLEIALARLQGQSGSLSAQLASLNKRED